MKMSIYKSEAFTMAMSVLFGIIFGYLDLSFVNYTAKYLVIAYVKILKFISMPIVFLSITATIIGFRSVESYSNVLITIIKYTLATTIIAATIAMVIYRVIDPVRVIEEQNLIAGNFVVMDHMINIIPDNLIKIFLESNVMAVVFTAFLLGIATTDIQESYQSTIKHYLDALFAVFMQIAKYVLAILPFILWAFIVELFQDSLNNPLTDSITLYILAIMLANAVQALVILPLFLKWKGISPIVVFKSMRKAISVAFFTKSSTAALPSTIEAAIRNLKIDPKIAAFSLPLCATVNMNACAAFIYMTVIFIAQSQGMVFTNIDYITWIFLATIAAVGNAGVPMGCFFMSAAYLSGIGVSTQLMAIILPFYTILDMFETAINVWSDACVTAVVADDVKKK